MGAALEKPNAKSDSLSEMQKALILSLVLVLAALLASGSWLHGATIPVSADAYVDGTNKSANFGTNSTLTLEQSALGGDKAYLRFDASAWGATNLGRVESLRVVWAASTNITRSIYSWLITGTGANSWTENGITWSNAPANKVTGTDRGFVAYPGQTVTGIGGIQYAAGTPRELTIPFGQASAQETALLTALNTGDRKATIGVSYNSSLTSSVAIYSREYGGGIYAATLTASAGTVLVPPMTDTELFAKLDPYRPGLEAVRSAVATNNLTVAKAELARYFRGRTGVYYYIDAHDPARSVTDPAGCLKAAQPLVNRTGDFDAQYWTGDMFDWERTPLSYKDRMYFFDAFGKAAAVETGDDVARALVNLIRSFAYEYHSPVAAGSGMWTTMATGIRMRSGWPAAFQCLLQSAAFTDEDIVLFLKTVWDQTDYIHRDHSDTSNWLTFEMAGLYTSGVVYPEFLDATEWRRFACQTAMDDISRGWLPDGMSIEKSATYGTFFSNYYVMYDLAQFVGRLSEFNFVAFPSLTERLFEAYLKLMTPDRLTPILNDGGQADVAGILNTGLTYFTNRDDFRWIVTQGKQGGRPSFTSVAFPYAGYLVLRSGWETNANYLLCDAGPVGYRHAHQDKLQVVLWAYGRQILFDSSRGVMTGTDWTYENYFRDTFSHSTGLVDNRPQRRRWYEVPSPVNMPYQPLADFKFQITEGSAWASGSFTNSYGLAGSVGNDAYPYKVPSNFYDGWGTPASHSRQVAYAAPDVFIVQDWFVPTDTNSHTYELRWQLDSVKVALTSLRAETTDQGVPNLAVVPLQTNGLAAATVSGKLTNEVMGWVVHNDQFTKATTLRHSRTGTGPRSFLTLLYPLRKGVSSGSVTFQEQNGAISLNTGDGRVFSVHPAAQPGDALIIDDAAFKDSDGDGIPDWWEIKYFAGPTNATATGLCANGINTLREAYLAGLDPTDPAARFEVRCRWPEGRTVLSWNPALPERTYSVLASRNLSQGFVEQTVVLGPTNTYTNTTPGSTGFYRVRVQRNP